MLNRKQFRFAKNNQRRGGQKQANNVEDEAENGNRKEREELRSYFILSQFLFLMTATRDALGGHYHSGNALVLPR